MRKLTSISSARVVLIAAEPAERLAS